MGGVYWTPAFAGVTIEYDRPLVNHVAELTQLVQRSRLKLSQSDFRRMRRAPADTHRHRDPDRRPAGNGSRATARKMGRELDRLGTGAVPGRQQDRTTIQRICLPFCSGWGERPELPADRTARLVGPAGAA